MNASDLAPLILAFPAIGVVIIALVGRRFVETDQDVGERWVGWFASLMAVASFVIAVLLGLSALRGAGEDELWEALRRAHADVFVRSLPRGLDEPVGERGGQLSGGQRQRVALGRAIVRNPKVFLFDEPLSNLDAKMRVQMRSEISRLHAELGSTMIYVTHDQVEAMTLGDRIAVMKDGLIEQAGTPEDIYQRPQSEFVARFIGGTNIFKGKHNGDSAVACEGGLVLRCGSGDFRNGAEMAVSIRHHDIRLHETKPAQADTNLIAGTVTRQIYLGSHRDYLVSIPGGETVRTIAPVNVAIPAGQEVWLHFPPEFCRALAH